MIGRSGSGGGCGAIVVLAVVLILIVTWPWWLLLIPLISIFVLAGNDALRSRTISAFATEEVAEDTARTRESLMKFIAVLCAISVLYCLFAFGLEDVQWWLIPLMLLAAVLRLYALGCNSRKWPKLQRAFADNLFELALICAAVLFAYTIALWSFHALPLNDVTLGKLKGLEGSVAEKHKWLEEHKPHFNVLVGLLGLILALRVAAVLRPAMRTTINAGSKTLIGGVKWSERVATAAAVAASLTFLATGQNGPVLLPISLSLQGAQKNYDSFRTDIEQTADIALRQALIEKAWDARSAALKSEMIEAAGFFKERQGLVDEQKAAAESLGITTTESQDFPVALDASILVVTVMAPETSREPRSPSLSWTPSDLHKTAEEAKDLRAAEATKEKQKKGAPSGKSISGKEGSDDASEMAKEALDDISPADKLFAVGPIELLKTHYPVFGEFVDAVSSSITEAAFDSLRDSVVNKVEQKKCSGGPNLVLAEVVSQEVGDGVASIRVDLSRFDQNWGQASDARIRSYKPEIVTAKTNLENLAFRTQLARTEAASHSASAVREELLRVAKETGSASLLQEAKGMQKVLLELLAIGKTWPALAQPSDEQKREMSRIFAELDSSGWKILGPDAKIDFRSPLVAIVSSETYCREALLHIVGGSGYETAKLRAAMGSDYERYYSQWQQRVEMERKQQQEQARQEKARQAEEQRIREYEYREMHPVEDHPVDHPVEIP